MRTTLVVVVLALVVALPATAGVGVSLGTGLYSESMSYHDLPTTAWWGIEVVVKSATGERVVAQLNTHTLISFDGLRSDRVLYRISFMPTNFNGVHGAAVYLPRSPLIGGDADDPFSMAAQMNRQGDQFLAGQWPKKRKFWRDVNYWTVDLYSPNLVAGANPMLYLIWGKLDEKQEGGAWGIVTGGGGSRNGMTEDSMTLNLRNADLSSWSVDQIRAWYLQRGWYPITDSGQPASASEPSEATTTPQITPEMLATLASQPATATMSPELANCLSELAKATQANANSQEKVMALLRYLADREDQALTSTPTTPTPATSGLRLLVERASYKPVTLDGSIDSPLFVHDISGLKITASLPTERGQIVRTLIGPNGTNRELCDFNGGQEEFTFVNFDLGTYVFSVNYEGETISLILEVTQ